MPYANRASNSARLGFHTDDDDDDDVVVLCTLQLILCILFYSHLKQITIPNKCTYLNIGKLYTG